MGTGRSIQLTHMGSQNSDQGTSSANTSRKLGPVTIAEEERAFCLDSLQQTTPKQKSVANVGSSLAARRNLQMAQVGRPAGPLTISTTRNRRRCITWSDNVAELYSLHAQVMPSCHSGMEVRHATRIATREEVVIKVRHKNRSFKSRTEEKEWRASTELMLNLRESDSIARLHEVLEDRRAYYVVMEKVQGLDLFETLSSDGPMNVDEVKEVAKQLLTAIRELHDNGCIHKDLKLENVMVDRSPSRASPMAFGTTSKGLTLDKSPSRASPMSSTFSRNSQSSVPKERLSPTVSVKLIDFDTVEEFCPATPKSAKDVLGTDQYIAQEAYDGSYSFASDIFAVGVILYKLLTGRFPFDNNIFDDEAGENWVGSPKMKEIRSKLVSYGIDWNHKIFRCDPEAMDLPKRMLQADSKARPSAKEALEHPWLRSPVPQPERRVSSGLTH